MLRANRTLLETGLWLLAVVIVSGLYYFYYLNTMNAHVAFMVLFLYMYLGWLYGESLTVFAVYQWVTRGSTEMTLDGDLLYHSGPIYHRRSKTVKRGLKYHVPVIGTGKNRHDTIVLTGEDLIEIVNSRT